MPTLIPSFVARFAAHRPSARPGRGSMGLTATVAGLGVLATASAATVTTETPASTAATSASAAAASTATAAGTPAATSTARTTTETSTTTADDDGFVSLVDPDLSAWTIVVGDERTWAVEDDTIICFGRPMGFMRTNRMYENFVLELEWRHLQPGGNAGIFVWSDGLPAVGQPFPRSVEVQVMDGPNGSWYTTHGDVFPIHGATMEPENGRDSMRAYPTEERSKPSPEWNHYRVTCVDGSVTLEVNGKVVTRGHAAVPRRGYLCLEPEGSRVEFRDIRIKELPSSDTPLPPNEVAMSAEGFRPLYGGLDFRGWQHTDDHEGHFQAADWRIAFDGSGPDLWTTEHFGDVELLVDWRWTGEATEAARPVIAANGLQARDADGAPLQRTVADAGDSGIYLRGSSKSQVNIWCWPVGSGEVYGYRTDGSMPADVRAGVTPRVAADRPIGQWNRFRIRMVGERLTVDLNGVRVLDEARLPGVAPRGPIALQSHGGRIDFANIFVRELDAPADDRAAFATIGTWLPGHWRMEGDDGTVVEEFWTSAGGGTMFGANRTVRDGTTAAHEFIRIEHDDTGVGYFAMPGGRGEPERFDLVRATAFSAIFERGGDDAPQRLVYRLDPRDDDRLTVTAEDADGAALGRWVFRRQG